MFFGLTLEDYILLLLNLDNQKPITGKLFLQKEMFLLSKEVSSISNEEKEKLEKCLNYIPYKYGPYSSILENELTQLENQSYITSKNEGKSISYSITEKGMEKINKKNIITDIKNEINKLKIGSDKLGYKGLLKYVYFTYPKYTTKSERNQI